MGYTEHMSAMSASTRATIRFKPLPMSDNNCSHLFYADVIAVHTKSKSRGTRDLAVQLANVMASKQTMIASIGPDSANLYPQYLMATRPSVFAALGKEFPIYNDMYSMVKYSDPIMFKLPLNSKKWLDDMKNPIRAEARDQYPCACDQLATSVIPDNSAAKGICTATCANYGGWTGQWTNQSPAAPSGNSVCACNACAVGQ